jgi:hypothetical protein
MQNSLLVCCGCLEPLGGLALYKSHACVLLLIRNFFPLLSVTSCATCVGL